MPIRKRALSRTKGVRACLLDPADVWPHAEHQDQNADHGRGAGPSPLAETHVTTSQHEKERDQRAKADREGDCVRCTVHAELIRRTGSWEPLPDCQSRCGRLLGLSPRSPRSIARPSTACAGPRLRNGWSRCALSGRSMSGSFPSWPQCSTMSSKGAPAVRCVLGPVTRWFGGQWLGAPVHGLEDLAAVVFDATEALVPVTHPQPFQADVVLARGRVPKDLAGHPVSGSSTARSISLVADRSSVKAPRFEDLATIPLG
jgi:hypothetical protein